MANAEVTSFDPPAPTHSLVIELDAELFAVLWRPTLSPATPTHQPWSRCGSSCTCAISAALGGRRRRFSGGAGWQGLIPTHRNAHFFHDPHRHLRATATSARRGSGRRSRSRGQRSCGSRAGKKECRPIAARNRRPATTTAPKATAGAPHQMARKSAIVTIKRKSRFGDAPDLTPEEHQRRQGPPMRCGANWVRRATAKWMTCGEHPGGDWVGRTVLNTITG